MFWPTLTGFGLFRGLNQAYSCFFWGNTLLKGSAHKTFSMEQLNFHIFFNQAFPSYMPSKYLGVDMPTAVRDGVNHI
jgi:hypothetical protein